MSQLSKKIVQSKTRGQCTIVHEAPEAEGKAREASNLVCRTVRGTIDDWTQCHQIRATTFYKITPGV